MVRLGVTADRRTDPLPITKVRPPALPMSFPLLILQKAISLSALVIATEFFRESITPRPPDLFRDVHRRGGCLRDLLRCNRRRWRCPWDIDRKGSVAVWRWLWFAIYVVGP